MHNFSINYLSEKNLDQVKAACRYAFQKLNFTDEEVNFSNDGENYYLVAEKREYGWFKDLFIKIDITESDDKKKLAINVDIDRPAIGRNLQNECKRWAYNFINFLKEAESSFLNQKEQEEIYELHLEYVNKLAKKFIKRDLNKGLPFEDLVKEGRLGLRKAAENFCPTRGYMFSTYAYWWLNRYMSNAVEAQGPDTITYKFQKQKKYISEADELKKFAELKDQGIITEEEFNAKKRQILDL
tara:strand:- start:568 stop:1290 length:723 start_codon:yes stop_codon:yes gene_type:complete